MKAINIKLSLAENVKSFVNIANRYPYVMSWMGNRFWAFSAWICPSRSRSRSILIIAMISSRS